MNQTKNTTSIISNFLWRFAERVGAQGVKLLVELVLARLLLPDDYGIIALVTVFITIFNVFVDSGLGNALIQKKDADDLDFSSVFWFNFVWCIFLYIILFFTSPIIADFFRRGDLVLVLRVLGLQILISGIKNVEQAYVSRTLQFKKFFFATLGGTLGAAVIGIYMAYHGYGVWALVAQHLFNTLVDTIILWITVKWKPKFIFSIQRLKKLFTYGWKLLISQLIDTIYTEIRQLVIGRIYTSSELAYYNRGRQVPFLIVNNVNTSIDSVLLPTMSNEQDNKDRVKAMTRRAIQVSTYVMAPLMMGLAFIGNPLIKLVLTDKWLPAVPFLRVFCITFMFYPIHTANLNAIKAMGRSDLFLKLEVVKKTIGVIALLSTMHISVEAMAYSLLVVSVCSQIINSWPNKKLLGYSYFDQLKDIMPSVLLAVSMGVLVHCVEYLKLPELITIIIQIPVGACVYYLGSKLFKIESFYFLHNLIKRKKH